MRRLALRATLTVLIVAFGAGLLYVSFRNAMPEPGPPPPVRTFAEVRQRVVDLAQVVEGHLPGRRVRELEYFPSACPQSLSRSAGLRGLDASMELEMRRDEERIQKLDRMRDALRAAGWVADFPVVVKQNLTQNYLKAESPDGYHLSIDGEHWDTSVIVDLEAPCFVEPKD